MYLSLILLDPFSRRVQSRHRTEYQTHRSILRAFPEPLPLEERILFRREEVRDPPMLRLLVQSQTHPDWTVFVEDHQGGLLAAAEAKPYAPVFRAGQMLAFRLLANPTVKRNGRRLGLLREADQLAWLLRKGEVGGFAVDTNSLRLTKRGTVHDGTAGGQALSLHRVRFDGLLHVLDPVLFGQTLEAGIGSGKGLGCGLLSVAPVR